MDTQRKLLNQQQTKLREIMMSFRQHDLAIRLFLQQHAMLHSSRIAEEAVWSFEDVLIDDISEEHIRRIPRDSDHSIAWCIWHIARIEDITMNELVAGESQVMKRGKWSSKLKTAIHHTGNAMSPAEVARLSRELDIVVLRDYRVAVGKRTREIVEKLPPESLKQRVDPIRLERVLDQGDVEERSKGIVDYWSKRNIAGLLLMPATRHNLVHLNEGLKLKRNLK